MIPSAFDYVAATSVEEAIQALSEAGEDAKVLAGGQSLLPGHPWWRPGARRPGW